MNRQRERERERVRERERDERGERGRIVWNSVGTTNLTWWYLEEANKILFALPFNLY